MILKSKLRRRSPPNRDTRCTRESVSKPPHMGQQQPYETTLLGRHPCPPRLDDMDRRWGSNRPQSSIWPRCHGLGCGERVHQGSGIEINADGLWSELQDNCRQYTVDGEYLALLGFEWIGDPAAAANCGDNSCSQGHHNIYYSDCDGLLADLDPNIIDGLEGDKGLWTWLQQQDSHYTSIPHAMQYTRFDFDARDTAHQHLAKFIPNGVTTPSTSRRPEARHRCSVQASVWVGLAAQTITMAGWETRNSTKNTPSGLAGFLVRGAQPRGCL